MLAEDIIWIVENVYIKSCSIFSSNDNINIILLRHQSLVFQNFFADRMESNLYFVSRKKFERSLMFVVYDNKHQRYISSPYLGATVLFLYFMYIFRKIVRCRIILGTKLSFLIMVFILCLILSNVCNFHECSILLCSVTLGCIQRKPC